MYIVLVYDISQTENGRKRWANIFKICKKYLSHIQNSVFEGELSKPQLMKLQKELEPYIDETLDSVILFKSRQEKWLDKEFWGKMEDRTDFML
ncbi:MAG TPA: CRISPR-associated endonuclease Cas2 [Candidatus Eisenbergiella stercoravium]|nr:CRISPR-associated endonuclease Cas2 [Candidatus Eisenbergiella stercoravium]